MEEIRGGSLDAAGKALARVLRQRLLPALGKSECRSNEERARGLHDGRRWEGAEDAEDAEDVEGKACTLIDDDISRHWWTICVEGQ